MNVSKMLISVLALVFATTGCLPGVQSTGSSSSNGSASLPPADFTAPPVVTPPPDPVTPVERTIQGLEIQGGVTRTKDTSIRALIFPGGPIWYKMKLGWSADCSVGNWEPARPFRDLTLPERNKEMTLSVQFSDGEGLDSDCFTRVITHDSEGPAILVKRYPAPSIEEGAAPEIEYEITDSTSRTTATCNLNGVDKPCPTGGPHVITLTNLPEGNYTFTFNAQDDLGNSSSSEVSWSVVSTFRKITQTFDMNNYRKVDILMIIDNSGSMEYEQINMAQRTSSFLSILSGLDWQIGITTTDPRDIPLGDGRLIPIYNGNNQYLLDSSMPQAEAQNQLSMTLQRPETGSGSEQAIYATYRAVERSLSNDNPYHRQLIRTGAQFAGVVISDEDESANGPKNDPHNLMKFISDSFGGQKAFSFHSIITRPGDQACKDTYGYSFGERFFSLSQLTGGVVGSVCEQDYAQQVIGVANGIRNLLKTMTLECQPIAGQPITVMHDGQVFFEPFVVEGLNLRFSSELPPGKFSVEYRCLK